MEQCCQNSDNHVTMKQGGALQSICSTLWWRSGRLLGSYDDGRVGEI